MNDLIIIDLEKTNALELFVPEKVDDFLSKVEKEVLSFNGDISTDKGRKEIASFAYKIAKLKTKFDDLGKDLVSDWKEKSKLVDIERKKGRDKLDELKDLARKPLTDFENEEKLRIETHESNISAMDTLLSFIDGCNIDAIEHRIMTLQDIDVSKFEEFTKRATETKERVMLNLEKLLADTKQKEAEKAELEMLRKKEEERKQKEREEQIAQEAKKRAEREAEEKARIAKEQAEKERLAIIKQKEEAESRAKAEQERMKREAEEAKLRAEREKQEAVEAERRAIAEQKAKQEAEQLAREKDKNHKAKINNEVLVDLLKIGLTEELAKEVIKAIAKGAVANVKINY
jgi:colicin import membrane protein